MREILFKNLTGSNHRKRDLTIKEIVTRNGMSATVERRCVYFVRNIVKVKDSSDLKSLEELKIGDEIARKKPEFHILRKYDEATGDDKLICKVSGKFYVISDNKVYCIAFVHSFKIRLEVDLSVKN